MKYKSLLLCMSILVIVFAGCSSSQQSQQLAEQQARLDADHAAVTEQAEAARQTLAAAEATLAAAEEARIAAETAAKQAKTAEASRAAAEAKKKADEAAAKAIEEQKLAAQKAAEQARAAEEARVAAQQARAAAQQAKADARQKAKVQTVNLASGAPINVITTSEISTKTANTGDVFSVVLNEDITSGNNVIARRGSTVKGVITDSDPGGRVKGVATISLTLTTLTLSDGSEVSIKTNNHEKDAPSATGQNVAKTGIGAGIGAAIGAIAGGGRGAAIGAGIGGAAGAGSAMLTHGNPAEIAPETPITFNLTAPLNASLRQ